MRTLKGLFLRKGRPDASAVMADPAVAELSKKLWAGFSRHARKELDEMVRAAQTSRQKTLAAWELAKFHAFEAQWQRTLDYLEMIHDAGKDLLRRNGAGALYVEALVACGRSDEAERYVQRMIDKRKCSTHYHCALSNSVAAPAVRQKKTADRQLMRLALLNSLYSEANLAEVGLIDPGRGFVFGNLAIAEGSLSDVFGRQKISVLMTVFNAESSVSTAVSSVLNQTWRNMELVIVDDASTDASWELVEPLVKRDSRVIHVRNATSAGMYQARNRALSLASGSFLAVHDGDHWVHPQMLQTQVQAMLDDPEIKLAFASEACVSSDMKYALGLGRKSTKYVHRSRRSYLIGRPDLQRLDKWDSVTANADDEFAQRASTIWGKMALRDVVPNVPMSLCLKRSPDPLRDEDRSPTSGVRREYAKQAAFWRKNILVPAQNTGQGVPMERTGTKQPFPVPSKLVPGKGPGNRRYDVIIVSDLTLLGGTRRCNEGYIAAATNLGMKVGLFHWARYDLRLSDDIAEEYRILSYSDNVDILTAEERVSADLVLIHHPPIMKYLPDTVPRIDTKRLAILVNQLPQRFGEESEAYYQREDVEAACADLFGVPPVWIPISPLVRRILSASGFAPLAREDWIPPLGKVVVAGRNARRSRGGQRRNPIIGRHSRDHVTKWPEVEKDLRAAYCADSESPGRFLGGAKYARRVLTRWPENWEDLAFDSITVSDFLNGLDFFVHFTHSAYVEEFGRNIMEAMAAGMPAVVPPRFREVFGDAACYAEPKQVEELICTLWDAESAYAEQVEKGFHFVREFASNERVEQRLQEATHGAI